MASTSSSSNSMEDKDDIFGPPRTTYCSPKNRTSIMIGGTSNRKKDLRKRVLKLGNMKLNNIKDRESSLCRCTLLCNTINRLMMEAHEEKIRKRQMYYPNNENYQASMVFDSFNEDMDAISVPVEDPIPNEVKPSLEDLENLDFLDFEIDIQELLSQIYMPPTPELLTSIDDDCGGGNSVDQISKRPRLETLESDSQLRLIEQTNEGEANAFTCGQALMCNDLQNNALRILL